MLPSILRARENDTPPKRPIVRGRNRTPGLHPGQRPASRKSTCARSQSAKFSSTGSSSGIWFTSSSAQTVRPIASHSPPLSFVKPVTWTRPNPSRSSRVGMFGTAAPVPLRTELPRAHVRVVQADEEHLEDRVGARGGGPAARGLVAALPARHNVERPRRIQRERCSLMRGAAVKHGTTTPGRTVRNFFANDPSQSCMPAVTVTALPSASSHDGN